MTSEVMDARRDGVDDGVMDISSSPVIPTPEPALRDPRSHPHDGTGPLRTVLGLDAAAIAVGGLVLAAAAGPVNRAADVQAVGATRIVGIVLLVLAVDLALLARARRPVLLRFSAWSAGLDAGWVVASLVVAATVDMAGTARAVVVLQAVVVAAVAATKVVTRRRAGDGGEAR